MRSSRREDIVGRLDALQEVVSDLLELSFDALTTPERLGLLERLEHETRRLPVAGSALINQLRRQAGETELGGKPATNPPVAACSPLGQLGAHPV
jgi:hypothetical protein